MQRFLLLWTNRLDGQRHYSEGLVHVDGAVYVRGFYPAEGKLYGDILALRHHMRDNDDIRYWHIYMIDEKGKD